jgi:C-terminal processing protease CtpA/Prc
MGSIPGSGRVDELVPPIPGPVERSGLVKLGDYLVGINGLSLLGLGLEQMAQILQNVDKMGEVGVYVLS